MIKQNEPSLSRGIVSLRQLGSTCLLVVLAICASNAFASQNTGAVLIIRSVASQTNVGYTRVSVQVSGTTSCGFQSWYSYEFAANSSDSGIGKVWTAQLLAAQQSGRNVTISGTGACDQYNIEIIGYVDTF